MALCAADDSRRRGWTTAMLVLSAPLSQRSTAFLPVSVFQSRSGGFLSGFFEEGRFLPAGRRGDAFALFRCTFLSLAAASTLSMRSEERRVGKECRSRW